MNSDANGDLWVALWKAGKLMKVDHKTNADDDLLAADAERRQLLGRRRQEEQLHLGQPAPGRHDRPLRSQDQEWVEFPLPEAESDPRRIDIDPTNPNRIFFSGNIPGRVGLHRGAAAVAAAHKRTNCGGPHPRVGVARCRLGAVYGTALPGKRLSCPMTVWSLYLRVLASLQPDARVAWALAAANVALASAQFIEPVLFGRIIDTLANAQGGSRRCHGPTSSCLGVWVGFGSLHHRLPAPWWRSMPTGWRIAIPKRCAPTISSMCCNCR